MIKENWKELYSGGNIIITEYSWIVINKKLGQIKYHVIVPEYCYINHSIDITHISYTSLHSKTDSELG